MRIYVTRHMEGVFIGRYYFELWGAKYVDPCTKMSSKNTMSWFNLLYLWNEKCDFKNVHCQFKIKLTTSLKIIPVLNYDPHLPLFPREALNFHFGIGVWPEGPNRGACERTTAKFGTLLNWIFQQNVALWTAVWSNLRLWNWTLCQFWGFWA